jgi:hypothetical protein
MSMSNISQFTNSGNSSGNLSGNFLKKMEYELQYLVSLVKNGPESKTVLFYPEYPSKRTIIHKMMKHLKFNITDNLGHKFNLAINWEDTTFRNSDEIFSKLTPGHKVLNIKCKDISKVFVDLTFEKVFGYGLNIDPGKYKGECVKKSNLNAKHDGIIINYPAEKIEDGFIYQRILNNRFDDELVFDIRIPVVKDNIPFVYLKFKKIEERFTNNIYKSTLEETSKYLSKDEIKKIILFCSQIGLDYGELDVIRNKDDNKVYIVDVNNTPWGPPFRLPENDGKTAIEKLAEVFAEKFLL